MNPKIQELLKDYPVISTIKVQWGDMDAARHVNNIIYLKWFETGRIEYFELLGFTDFSGEKLQIGPILGSIQCKYIFPVTYPDTVFIGTRVRDVEKDRFVIETAIVSERHERLAALGSGVAVAYDYKKLQKASLPEELKNKIITIEGA